MRIRALLPTVAGTRGVAAACGLVARRRARPDRWLLLALYTTVAVSAFLATAGPQLLDRTFAVGARGAIASAGRDTDVRASFPLLPKVATGADGSPTLVPTTLGEFAQTTESVRAALPPALRRVAGPLLTTVTSAPLTLLGIAPATQAGGAGASSTGTTRAASSGGHRAPVVSITLGSVTGPGSGVHYTRGGPPTDASAHPGVGAALPVAVSETLARTLALAPGDRMRVRPAFSAGITLVVTGVYAVDEPAAIAWQLLPGAVTPRSAPDGTTVAATVLLDVTALPTAQIAAVQLAGDSIEGSGLRAQVDQTVDASLVDADAVTALQAQLDQVSTVGNNLPGVGGASVDTGLPAVLGAYLTRAHAARAQLSLVVVGVVGAAVVVILLGAQLLVARRSRALALEHARGSSITGVAVRAGAEAGPLSLVAGLIGALASGWLVPTDSGGLPGLLPRTPVPGARGPLITVVAAAALGPALLAAWTAWRSWGRRQAPANRGARNRITGRRRLRRAVGEGVVLVLAVAAVISLRGRGLVQSQTGGVDLFLAAAPLLLALAVTVLVLRAYPWPVRALAALARTRRGVVGVVAGARATTALATLPLLGLAVSVGLVVTAGLIRDTVTDGQLTASWQRVGADVRVEAPLSDAEVRTLGSAPGVTALATGHRQDNLQVKLGNDYEHVTLVGVDGRRLGALWTAQGERYRGELAALGAPQSSGRLPVVLSPDLAARLRGQELALFLGDTFQRTRVVGLSSVDVRGWLSGYVVYGDAASLARILPKLAPTNLAWVDGPGADAAVQALPAASATGVHSRTHWLSQTRDSPLLAEVLRLFWLAVLVLAAFAATALLATVLGGARERATALSTLRTLGLSARQGRWLTLGELAPLVLAGAAAGAIGGVVTVSTLGPALGLLQLTGGLDSPGLSLDPLFVLEVVAGLALLFVFAALVEVAVHRRDRLAEVLRVGDVR